MKYQVKLEGACIVTGFVTVEAESAAQALLDVKTQVEVDIDALGDPSWEFVDLKTVVEVDAVEVWDEDEEDVVYPPEPADGAGDA